MNKISFEEVNAQALARYPALLFEWFPNGKLQGNEFKIGDLTGAPGDSLCINVNTGKWADFAGDVSGGDPIALRAAMLGLSQLDAAKELSELMGNAPTQAAPAQAAPAKKPKWEELRPPAENVPEPDFRHGAHGEPAARWAYFREFEGGYRLIGYVCRFNLPDGSKEIIPLTYAHDGKGRTGWRWTSAAKPRPLYNLPELGARPRANVLLVEGEKTTEAARILFPQAVCMTWPGGGKAVKHADWAPLQGRKVVIWPDNDEPGFKAAHAIAGILTGIAAEVRAVMPPHEAPEAWDVADAKWTPAEAFEYLKGHLCPVSSLPHGEEAPAAPAPEYDPEDLPEVDGIDDWAFQCLGYDHGSYFYLSGTGHQIIELTGPSHTQNNLLTLAPLQYWEAAFASKKGPQWDMAINAMMRKCERAGVFDTSRIRGRGAWWDDGSTVLHLGDRVIIDGQTTALEAVKSRYFYEAAPPMRVDLETPLGNKDAFELVELCRMMPWEKPMDALFLAGWCFIAPICGALSWRPHIWITGPAGSGKTWIFDHILRRCLGDTPLAVQSETTEAGLRQALGNDARPVVFDEAEGEDTRAQNRIQNVLALMRQASSEGGAVILKGSATGVSKTYRVRSCFAFASIGVNVHMHADQTRITVLSLQKDHRLTPDERQERFVALQKRWLDLVTPAYIEKLQSRAIKMVPIIRQNAETFAVAGSSVIGTRRMGDQIGALLAGAFCLHSAKAVTLEEATEWLKKQDWREEMATQESRDEDLCLSMICESIIRVMTGRGQKEESVAELIRMADSPTGSMDEIDSTLANVTLGRHGIKVMLGVLYISNTHSGIARMLANTPWARTWGKILKRIDGATVTEPMRFGPGIQTRATAIEISKLWKIS